MADRDRDPLARLADVRRATLEGAGTTSRELRRAVAGRGGDVPADLAPVVDKVRRHAYKVTDEDIAALRAAGRSEDEIFELTCATAVGVALDRVDRAFNAIGDPPATPKD